MGGLHHENGKVDEVDNVKRCVDGLEVGKSESGDDENFKDAAEVEGIFM